MHPSIRISFSNLSGEKKSFELWVEKSPEITFNKNLIVQSVDYPLI